MLTVTAFTAYAGESGTPVTVTATGLESPDGQLVLLAYDNEEDWLTARYHTREIVALAGPLPPGGDITIDIRLPAGEYALLLFHDLDGDGQLRRNLLGIPREPLGLSGAASARFGPPDYREAAVRVDDTPLELVIGLR